MLYFPILVIEAYTDIVLMVLAIANLFIYSPFIYSPFLSHTINDMDLTAYFCWIINLL